MPSQMQKKIESSAASGATIGSLPPIRIDVFCKKTHEAVKKVASDRRAARANISLFDGGVDDAIQYYTGRNSPDLLIVEIPGEGSQIMEMLDKLAGVCTVETKVIIIGTINDINTYHRIIEIGVSDYLAHPATAIQLLASIAAVYGENGGGGGETLGRIIAFVGSRGGTGSSTIALNTIWQMSRQIERKVVLADFDFAFGTLALACNLDPGPGSYDLVSAKDNLDDALFERLCISYDSYMSLLPAPGMPDRDYPSEPDLYINMLQFARRMTQVTAIDMPHLWTPWAQAVLMEADDIVMTVTPDLVSLRNSKSILDAFSGRRELDRRPILLLNQVGMLKDQRISARDFKKLLNIDLIAEIPFDPITFSNALTAGQRLDQISSRARAVSALSTAAKALSSTGEPRKQRERSLSSKLFSRFKRGG